MRLALEGWGGRSGFPGCHICSPSKEIGESHFFRRTGSCESRRGYPLPLFEMEDRTSNLCGL